MDRLISLQAAIDAPVKMVSEGIEWIPVYHIRALPSAQSETNCSEMPNNSDTISRQAAIEAIHEDADWLAAQGSDWQVERMERDKSILKSLPSAEPEIIHCKDCKHYYYADNRIPQEQMCTCDLDGDRWSPNSYCSFAERKTE